ncbi:MAG TPA: hypothetical protein VG077_17120 [Verrucomicrobiae bacterium]|nr:hypothetical protein [Verrucomicrobiae bacterium]
MQPKQSRTVHIQVKTKRGGRTWHASIRDGQQTLPPSKPLDETVFWVFVDLGEIDAAPRFWIVPEWWIRNDIYATHQAYLDRHGGARARSHDSTHHAIDESRLSEWHGKWEIMGILE